MIDGAKASHAAIREVFGSGQSVQRCRTHKIRNVLDKLPKEQHAQVRSLMRAAYKMENAAEGMARMEKLAQWIEREWPAAASLREGLEETFTINRLGLPPSLHPLPGDHEPHRESAVGRAQTNGQRLPLPRRGHGAALGGRRLLGDGEEFSEDPRLPGPVGTGRRPGPLEEIRHSAGEGGVRWASPAAFTFN